MIIYTRLYLGVGSPYVAEDGAGIDAIVNNWFPESV